MAPVPERANSISPQESEPAMPSALRMRSASRPVSLPQAIAAPNGPVVPGAWKPRPSLLVRGAPDADHDLRAGDEGGDQLAPADAALLGHCEAGSEQGRAGMHAGARPGQIVHLERVRERAVGQGGGGRMHARAFSPRMRLLPPAPYLCAKATTIRLQGRS